MKRGIARAGRRRGGPRFWAALAGLSCWLVLGTTFGQTPVETPEEARDFSAAARAFQDGIFERAEREFAEFAQKYPQSARVPEAILLQARAALRQQKTAAGVDLLTTNLTRAAQLADQYRYWLAEAHLRGSNYIAAAEAFAQVIRNFPSSVRLLEASYGEAKARFKLQQWPQVIELLRKPDGTFQKEARVRPNDELVVRGPLLLAEALLENQDCAAAEQVVTQLGDQNLTPEFRWQRQYLLLRILASAQRLPEALAGTTNLLALAVATGSRDLQAESVALQGGILERLGRPGAALQSYTNNLAVTAPPEYRRQALLRVTELALKDNRPAEAAQRLESFLAQYPQDVGADVALLTLGELHLKQHLVSGGGATNAAPAVTNLTNHLQIALGYFDRLLTNHPQSALLGQAQLHRGWCLWETGRMPESREAFQFAAERLPPSEDRVLARFKLADTCFVLKDFTNALAHYRAVIAENAGTLRAQSVLSEQALYQVLRVALELGEASAAADALQQLLERHPAGPFTERSLLLMGQNFIHVGKPSTARGLLQDFLKRFPESPLRPQVELTVARSLAEERDWPAAVTHYDRWVEQFPTNALRPRAEFDRAWVHARAGLDTNALALFTNFVARFATHELAPRAQEWVAAFHYRQGDYVNAERNYQLLFQNTNWPVGPLYYGAKMMAARAAIARQSYQDATNYLAALVNDNNCPPSVVAEAYFALGDTTTWQDADPARPTQKFSEAITAYGKIPLLYPGNRLAALAWGRIGNCYFQMAAQDPKAYDSALDAYLRVLAPTNRADVAARSQAEVGLGQVKEKLAGLRSAPESADLLKAALDHYLNILYGKNLAEGESPDAFWLKEAGLAAARLAEDLKQWDMAVQIYSGLAGAVPALRPTLEKKIDKAREQARPDKT